MFGLHITKRLEAHEDPSRNPVNSIYMVSRRSFLGFSEYPNPRVSFVLSIQSWFYSFTPYEVVFCPLTHFDLSGFVSDEKEKKLKESAKDFKETLHTNINILGNLDQSERL